jgi:transcriptional regulator with XRE-family HTH domain
MLGEALRLIRVYHDMKQKEAAKFIGVSVSYLSEIEKGHKMPSLEVIEKYSIKFGIPISSIMFFAESIEGGPSAERARSFIAGKMIGLMQFLEARAERSHAN